MVFVKAFAEMFAKMLEIHMIAKTPHHTDLLNFDLVVVVSPKL